MCCPICLGLSSSPLNLLLGAKVAEAGDGEPDGGDCTIWGQT